jgi:hypothetical protein
MTTEARQVRERALATAGLGRAVVALTAAWLLPGLGHVVLRRFRRGAAFAFLILSCYALGLLHDGRLALRDSKQPFLSALQVVANIGVGPADLLARWEIYGEPVYALPADERGLAYVEILRNRARSSLSLYGTAYLWTAGLMNLMLLFEVWDIATGRRD